MHQIICSIVTKMRNPIFFTLFFLLCMNVLSLANESIEDQEVIIRSPSFWVRLPARWIQPQTRSHHYRHAPPKHHQKHHLDHKRWHKHHRSHHNPPRHHKKWPHPSRPVPPPTPSYNHQNPPPQRKKDPQDCSTALLYVDGCLPNLISSYFGGKVRVNADCCHTIAGLSGTCFDEAFAQFETPNFTGRLKDFCAQLQ